MAGFVLSELLNHWGARAVIRLKFDKIKQRNPPKTLSLALDECCLSLANLSLSSRCSFCALYLLPGLLHCEDEHKCDTALSHSSPERIYQAKLLLSQLLQKIHSKYISHIKHIWFFFKYTSLSPSKCSFCCSSDGEPWIWSRDNHDQTY